MAMGRIVVGVDGSDSSRAALQWAIKQAQLTKSSLDIVVSWSQPMITASEPIIVPTPDTETLITSARTTADHMVADTGLAESGVEYQIFTPEGRAGEELVHIAKNADLLVVGSSGAGPLKELILGSVSSYASHHSPCPIVLVRATQKAPTDSVAT